MRISVYFFAIAGLREAIGVKNDDNRSYDVLIDHVKGIHDARVHEISDLKSKIENLEKEKYELVDSLNERYLTVSCQLHYPAQCPLSTCPILVVQKSTRFLDHNQILVIIIKK